MKRPVKILLTVISVLAALLCVLCILYIVQYFRGKALNEKLSSQVTSVIQAEDARFMESDVDFAALQEMNPDIYAWIKVPGTVINYPVVQSPDDDLFYVDHAVDKSYFTGGSIFSQRYNTKTFQDPVTVLYGHNRHTQTMFAQLNNFADAAYFQEHPSLYIYTPDKVYEYAVFAAYPHSSDHLLLCNDFTNKDAFDGYFADLTDGVNANYRREQFPAFGDKVLTLSTCYRENRMQRFLVQGVLREEYEVLQKSEGSK